MDAQAGTITRRQLMAVGFSSATVDRWRASGRLRQLHRGVYALGHAALTVRGRRFAAVLACGPLAALSHDDAGADHGLCRSRGTRIHVSVPPSGPRPGRRHGIHVHRVRLEPEEVVVRDGLRVTSVARTLRDLATVLGDDGLADAVDRAFELRVFDRRAIDRTCGRGRLGSAALRRVLAARHPDAHDTKSRWEAAMLRLLDAHGLARPEVNAWLADLRISPDLLYRDERLAIEWDSWRHHRRRDRFESDRRKTVALQLAGYAVLRFTWRQTQDEPELVVHAVRSLLSRTGGPNPR